MIYVHVEAVRNIRIVMEDSLVLVVFLFYYSSTLSPLELLKKIAFKTSYFSLSLCPIKELLFIVYCHLFYECFTRVSFFYHKVLIYN